MTWFGLAWLGLAWLDVAWYAWYDMGWNRMGMTWHDMACNRHGMAWGSSIWVGLVWHGLHTAALPHTALPYYRLNALPNYCSHTLLLDHCLPRRHCTLTLGVHTIMRAQTTGFAASSDATPVTPKPALHASKASSQCAHPKGVVTVLACRSGAGA